jgi:hypothetical protein
MDGITTIAMGRLLLGFSVLANFVLSAALLGIWPFNRDTVRTDTVATVQHIATEPQSPSRQSDGSSAGLASYYARLIALGLSREETKPLLLARADRDALATLEEPADVYWENNDGALLTYESTASERRDQARAALIEVYGADAKDDPAFSSLFRPFNRRFGFLSSEEQIEVARFNLRRQMGVVAANAQPWSQTPPASAGPSLRAATTATPPPPPPLAGVLDGSSLFEYELRDSPLAYQLRRSGVTFSEKQFRETYRILQHFDPARPQGLGETRDALRGLLGGRKFAQVWASRDPTLMAVSQAAKRRGLDNETTVTVLEIVNDSQDETRKTAVAYATTDHPRMVRELDRVRREEERRVVGLLGDEAGHDVLAARSQEALRVGRLIQQRESER